MITFLFGCGSGDPYAGKYTKTRPDSQSFVGEWVLKEWTMKRAQSLPSPLPKIILQGDGSFTATNYPGVALEEFSRGISSIDGQGKWSVVQYRTFWVIRIRWEIIAGDQKELGDMLHIVNDQPPYVLHHIIGDPDTGEALVFERVKK